MEKFPDTHKYDDIIHMEHPVSAKRGRMSMVDRGAQFSPFAALVGYDAAIRETARLTEERTELTEGKKEELDETLRLIEENLSNQPEVSITYFRPDHWKLGGSYVTVSGRVKKLDPYEKTVLLTDGQVIPVEEISHIGVDNLGHCPL